ncbi:transcription antitermination factor NusB [Seleniivibrio woodruffii]|uniref:Transcription antitermination protein NusB n=1 Tax=Seleniivibrio woodruffii TaxID=1078050 RepID=A0A4R1K918_9BACT|nr:transcription antitermination factor NusB [Seleniivibrio woodruffii]TCK60834.1 NusB antitermination factor [Seleniivibrio woodruffii]TVZ36464.1 NusB antitermination factor [Seleniivibrio woodruffii]
MKKLYKDRTTGRRYAFEMMYRFSVNNDENPKDISDSYWKSTEEESEDIREFACTLFLGAAAGVDSNDEIIKTFIREDWNYDRMGEVDRSILRVAVHELFGGKAPFYAVVNDFVTLARKYSDEKSASLVNGILENIRKKYNLSEDRVES